MARTVDSAATTTHWSRIIALQLLLGFGPVFALGLNFVAAGAVLIGRIIVAFDGSTTTHRRRNSSSIIIVLFLLETTRTGMYYLQLLRNNTK